MARGFTLVELLVALALMALLASMAWQGVASVAEAKRASDQRVNDTLRAGTVMAQWEHDLGQLHDTSLAPALAFDGATLRLVRRHDEGLQVIAWSLRDGRWLRWTSPVVSQAAGLQDAWLNSQSIGGDKMQDKIMDNEYIRGYIKTELDTLLKLAVKIDELYVANVLASSCLEL